jgi:catechol 2,3-dioxygenase-like lactoylglutathione lyase family enzyme
MQLQALSPILWTKNLQETISFYETVLGFKSRSSFPNFAALYRDNAEIMVIVPTGEPGDKDFFPKPFLTGSIYIFTQGVDEFWEFVKDKAAIKTPICNREYLMRDFSILDNNGYEIVFGEDISKR